MTDPRHWTPAQIAKLRKLYPDLKAETVAREIGRSVGSVHRKAALLGIGKSEAFKASFASGRINAARNDQRMLATRFKPGLTPWNKGVKGYQPGGRSAETRFKPGQKPHTTAPIGAYRVNVTKGIPRLEQKLNDKPGPNHVRWIPVSRIVWEQHYGPIKPKYIVVFADSKQATTVLEEITVDKLICITRAEHARRNSMYSKDHELGRLSQLKGAITRQINRITKEHKEKQA